MRVRRGLRVAVLLLAAGADQGCGGGAPQEAAGAATRDEEPPKPSSDNRLVGRWKLDLSKVPQGALTEQFKAHLRGGELPPNAAVHYIFDKSEMVLSLAGLGSREERRWYYEILRQSGDNLELQREAPDGKKDKMALTVTDTHMRLHTGKALLTLERVK